MSSLNKYPPFLFALVSLSLWPVVFFLTFTPPAPVSIFQLESENIQSIIRKTGPYPTVFLARAFQNKASIPITKFEHNLTALIDPSNYFYGFHPREIFAGLNTVKFPFVALPFFLFGFFYLPRKKLGRLLILSLIGLVLLLSLVDNFAVFDFVLYFPLSYIFFLGLMNQPNWFKKIKTAYLLICLPLAALEFARQIIILSSK